MPLEREWTFGIEDCETKMNTELFRFNTIVSFWDVYDKLQAEKIPLGTSLHLFAAKGVASQKGGVFRLVAKSVKKSTVLWQSLVLSLIGEQFPHSDCVHGVSLTARLSGHHNIISVWMYSFDEEKEREVRDFFKAVLHNDDYFWNKVELLSPVSVDCCPKTIDKPATQQRNKRQALRPTVGSNIAKGNSCRASFGIGRRGSNQTISLQTA